MFRKERGRRAARAGSPPAPANSARPLIYTHPTNRLLRWLTAPANPDLPPHIRDELLAELFTTPNTVLLGFMNFLLFDPLAFYLSGYRGFLVILALDVIVISTRMALSRAATRAAGQGRRSRTDLYLVFAISWCALEGSVCLLAMSTSQPVLQALAAVSATGLIGPICARNYPAPRYALLLVCLIQCQMVIGAALTGEAWMLLLVIQSPLYITGCMMVVRRLHVMSVAQLLAQHESQLRSQHDVLTGLLNRDGLTEALSALQAAGGQHFILFYLDLDGFKEVNDTYGHQAGDTLLVAVAQRLRGCTRATDTIARLGGDEFVIVAPDLAPEDGADMAESIIRRITDQMYPLGKGAHARIGVSIGFACSPEDGMILHELHGKADVALYRAKRAGKGVPRRFSQQVEDDVARLPDGLGGLAAG